VADVTKLPREVLRSFLLTERDYAMAPDGLPDAPAIQKTFDFLAEAGVLKGKVNAADVIDLRYHPRARR
jgi:hypothetical protein